jgi:hypothetical protein
MVEVSEEYRHQVVGHVAVVEGNADGVQSHDEVDHLKNRRIE